MTEEERETINHMKTRQSGGGGVSVLSLSESGSFKVDQKWKEEQEDAHNR